ncbi:MAG: hypothetical protein WC405_00905 [Syntrophales bacterium]
MSNAKNMSLTLAFMVTLLLSISFAAFAQETMIIIYDDNSRQAVNLNKPRYNIKSINFSTDSQSRGEKPYITGKWKLVEGYCAPGEQLIFTQVGDQVTSIKSKGYCSGGEYAEYEATNIQWQSNNVLTYRAFFTVKPPSWPEPFVDVTWKFLSNDRATGDWRKNGKSGTVTMERIR